MMYQKTKSDYNKGKILFEKMFKDIKVRITPEFRDYWGCCSGQWFEIINITDSTACLQDMYHQQFLNVPFREIIL